MKRKILCLMCCILLLLPLLSCGKTADVEMEVYTDQRMDPDGTVLATCRYEKPVVELHNKEVAAIINAYFDEWLNSSISWFNEVAGLAETDYHLQEEVSNSQWEDESYCFTDETTTRYWSNRDILTVVFDSYCFTGGVHGNYGRTAVMFNLSTGSEITLSDMVDQFKPLDETVQEEILGQIQKNIQSGEASYFDDYAEIVTEWNERTCYFNEEGLVVVFSIYDIAPYSDGTQEFLIPYEKIQSCLNSNAVKLLDLN